MRKYGSWLFAMLTLLGPLSADFLPDHYLQVEDAPGQVRPPRILLFNCHYGSGHEMATRGMKESLPDCEVRVVDIYEGPLNPVDPMRNLCPVLSNEHLYNKLAQHEVNGLLNFVARIGPKFLSMQRAYCEGLLRACVSEHQPDLIISCIPLVNPFLHTVAQEANLPFLVVTTDIDLENFCYGFDEDQDLGDWDDFRVTVPFDADSWAPGFIDKVPTSVQGHLEYEFAYPTRRAFSEEIEPEILDELRELYEIQADESVILVMMGGNTAKAARTYAKLLLKMSDEEVRSIFGEEATRSKIRLICLCGDLSKSANASLQSDLERLNRYWGKNNDRVQIHACAGTPRIAELVSLPELFTVISKPGGSTTNEMIKKRVPMLYHLSAIPLDWELGNMEYGVQQDLGRSYKTPWRKSSSARAELRQILTELFQIRGEILDGKRQVPEADFDFTENLRRCLQEMLGLSLEEEASA